MELIKRLFNKKVDTKQLELQNFIKTLIIPNGWYVQQAGQDPLHMLWYVVLVSFDDVCDDNIDEPKHYVAEEMDSYEDALRECISNAT